MAEAAVTLDVGGIQVAISNPSKLYFANAGITKLQLAEYYLAVGEAALVGCRQRPVILKRFPGGAGTDHFFQKRAPNPRPGWLSTTTVQYPSGRSADLVVIDSLAALLWTVNLGCIDINPWPVRATDTSHPDELRIDLDPTPQATFADVRRVALEFQQVLAAAGMNGFPKTSGSRGIHINVRIEPEHDFTVVRRCALALGREVERRLPELVTTEWWKERRHGVFVDYNQNARDRTVASVYSVRPVSNARVSCAVTWDEVADVEPDDLRLGTVPQRLHDVGDPGALIDATVHSLQVLLEWVARDESAGQGDAPWPPNFPKQDGEPPRVQPSRARRQPH